MGYVRKHSLYSKVPLSEADGYEIVYTKWLDINQGRREQLRHQIKDGGTSIQEQEPSVRVRSDTTIGEHQISTIEGGP